MKLSIKLSISTLKIVITYNKKKKNSLINRIKNDQLI
jgi:hypothetical protein